MLANEVVSKSLAELHNSMQPNDEHLEDLAKAALPPNPSIDQLMTILASVRSETELRMPCMDVPFPSLERTIDLSGN